MNSPGYIPPAQGVQDLLSILEALQGGGSKAALLEMKKMHDDISEISKENSDALEEMKALEMSINSAKANISAKETEMSSRQALLSAKQSDLAAKENALIAREKALSENEKDFGDEYSLKINEIDAKEKKANELLAKAEEDSECAESFKADYEAKLAKIKSIAGE